jgi:hypothetical protein
MLCAAVSTIQRALLWCGQGRRRWPAGYCSGPHRHLDSNLEHNIQQHWRHEHPRNPEHRREAGSLGFCKCSGLQPTKTCRRQEMDLQRNPDQRDRLLRCAWKVGICHAVYGRSVTKSKCLVCSIAWQESCGALPCCGRQFKRHLY